jgi:hypothetical protein
VKWLRLIERLICCFQCFATYQLDQTPDHCTDCEENLVEADEELPESNADKISKAPEYWGEPLFRMFQSVKTPVWHFADQSLSKWIGRLLSQPGIEDALN